MKIKECRYCGKEFISDDKKRKYCSHQCQQKMKKIQNQLNYKIWIEKHRQEYREYMREYMNKYRKEHPRPERFHIKAGTVYLKKTKNWNEEIGLLEKLLRPIRREKK